MGNGSTWSALTAPVEEARRGGQKAALWQAPSLPPWKQPDAGGKRALFGCPHCPRGRGQTRGAQKALSGRRPPCPRGRRPDTGWETGPLQVPLLPPWKRPDTRGKKALSARRPHCPRGSSQTRVGNGLATRTFTAPVFDALVLSLPPWLKFPKTRKRFCWAVEMLGRRRNAVKTGILPVFGPKPWTPPRGAENGPPAVFGDAWNGPVWESRFRGIGPAEDPSLPWGNGCHRFPPVWRPDAVVQGRSPT